MMPHGISGTCIKASRTRKLSCPVRRVRKGQQEEAVFDEGVKGSQSVGAVLPRQQGGRNSAGSGSQQRGGGSWKALLVLEWVSRGW